MLYDKKFDIKVYQYATLLPFLKVMRHLQNRGGQFLSIVKLLYSGISLSFQTRVPVIPKCISNDFTFDFFLLTISKYSCFPFLFDVVILLPILKQSFSSSSAQSQTIVSYSSLSFRVDTDVISLFNPYN